MAFTSYDSIIAAIASGNAIDSQFFKNSSTSQAAGVWNSLWTSVGLPGAGAAPAATPGTVHANTAGAVFLPDRASLIKSLLSGTFWGTQTCTLLIYDRLVSVGAITLVGAGAKTVNSAALPRYTDGIGVFPVIEVSAATATTAAVVALNQYTNSADQTLRAGGNFTFPAAVTAINSMFFLPLQAGDVGVKSVQVGINVVTAPTVGTVNLCLIKPLAYIPLIANIASTYDFVLQLTSLERLFDGASLGFAILPTVTTATTLGGVLKSAWG